MITKCRYSWEDLRRLRSEYERRIGLETGKEKQRAAPAAGLDTVQAPERDTIEDQEEAEIIDPGAKGSVGQTPHRFLKPA